MSLSVLAFFSFVEYIVTMLQNQQTYGHIIYLILSYFGKLYKI